MSGHGATAFDPVTGVLSFHCPGCQRVNDHHVSAMEFSADRHNPKVKTLWVLAIECPTCSSMIWGPECMHCGLDDPHNHPVRHSLNCNLAADHPHPSAVVIQGLLSHLGAPKHVR